MSGTSKMLSGIKVVELASVLAGPSVGMFLAELGASVVKVENPRTGGDPTRQWKTAKEDPDSTISAYYASTNWNKEVLFADLSTEQDRSRIISLIAKADVVLVNFKPGDDRKFGLDNDALRKLNPRLIIGAITGFPNDTRPAFDVVLQAETGMLLLNGEEGGPGLKWPLPIVDILAAHQLKEGILLALFNRERNGSGCEVEVSLFDAALASMYNVATNVLLGDAAPRTLGPLHPNIAPYGEIIRTSDDVPIVLAVGTDAQFASLGRLLGMDEAFMADFSTNAARVINRKALAGRLTSCASKLPFADLEAGLIARKIPFGRINSLRDVLKGLPDTYFLKQDLEGTKTTRMRTSIFKIRT